MRKIAAIVFIALAVGLWLTRAPYQRWRQQRSLAQAHAFFARSDFRNAALSAQQALAINPANVEACRIMARMTERARMPQAVSWRMRVVELEPGVTQNRFDLVRTCLLLGRYPQAGQALAGIPEAHRKTVDYQTMAAMEALARGDVAGADAHYAEAARLRPEDKNVKLNLAILDLQSKDQQIAQTALHTLEQLYEDPECRQDALRHLVMASLHNRDFTKAEVFSRKLVAETPPVFEDRMLRLGVLRESGGSEFAPTLASMESNAATNVVQINELGLWLMDHGQPDEALHWLLSLPVKIQEHQMVGVVLANCYEAKGNWPEMQSFLEKQKWRDIDFMRSALLARACREQKQEAASATHWNAATTAAANRSTQLSALVRLADAWGWQAEKEEAAWLLVERFPAERWALEMLHKTYTASNNTRGLQRVYAALMTVNASDDTARNNFAAISLLLNLQTGRAQEIARENYLRHPKDPITASTYAYALQVQHKTQDGLKILETLPEDQLERPAIATYYGVLLASAGQGAKAEKYLQIGERSPLLPEEKQLIVLARNTPVLPK